MCSRVSRRQMYVLLTAVMLMASTAGSTAEPIRFGPETLLPDDPRTHFSRAVNFAPGDGEVCTLNPPRFRWQYHPTTPGEGGDYVFSFQVATDREFLAKILDIETECNFYNTIPPFKGTGPFYWRIGYREREAGGVPTHWSAVRSFTLGADADVWDRSPLANPDFASKGHPRILFNKQTLPRLQKLVQNDKESQIIFANIKGKADRIVRLEWWDDIPEKDGEPLMVPYVNMAHDIALVAFCWRVTGDDKYAGAKERALRIARYPKGGRASPEGAGGESKEDSTQITEFLGLLYDWLYEDLTEVERRDFVSSLDWRIDHFVNNFAWRRPNKDGKLVVRGGSLGIEASSHSFEGFFDTFCAAVAAYEDSPHARECFQLGVNYMVGVGSAHGFDEGWNEGPGYGNSKWKWETNALCYLDSVFPELQMGKNPWLRRVGEFFRAQTPVGLKHAPWGHGSNRRTYYEIGHVASYRKLAFLTGDGRFLANWHQYGSVEGDLHRPWIECALPLWRDKPLPVTNEPAVRLFPRAGWVTALSGPPSDPDTYSTGVGMIFACRPRGGYSHAFCSDNSFHLFGYGQDLSHAAGTSRYEPYPYHTMSHNTILVDGLGQAQPEDLQEIPYYGRIMAFEAKDDAAYWCGDATLSYPQKRFLPGDWWGNLSTIYENRDLSYLTRVNRHVLFVRKKYFVMLDDLAAAQPAQWSWLYHMLEATKLDLNEETGSFTYQIGDAGVQVTHVLGQGQVEALDLKGTGGFRNPITGEDYTYDRGRGSGARELIAAHNLWITTREKHPTWRFLALIYPLASGENPPVVERFDDLTLAVRAEAGNDIISFDGQTRHAATIVVDLEAIAPAGLH